ncbi:hypothetical protein [Candidatus Laterigemmans baculatus]|uniref:hypothetical protein n=1 Tax=Candidatus Laterigemmans baculatus TaxID=2770505 RepID=UPI0013DBEA0C|nr:hypothetical protein [Candidatus Laterigemmans baculatus]
MPIDKAPTDKTPTVKTLIAVAVMLAATAGVTRGDDPLPPIELFDDAPSAVELHRSMPTAAELRQARALERRRQRIARLEAQAWAGYSPLRPNVDADPYTRSRDSVVRPQHIWSVWDFVRVP